MKGGENDEVERAESAVTRVEQPEESEKKVGLADDSDIKEEDRGNRTTISSEV
jgi:hypothetical protein